MRNALLASLLCAAAALPSTAQGTKPREKAEEYPVKAKLNGVVIAAENFGHGISGPHGSMYLRDYIAIEVAFFPTGKPVQAAKLATGEFSLRINGKAGVLLPQTSGMVAASIKYDDWEQRPVGTVSAGVGDAGVILGGPRQTSRFPGDPTGTRMPQPPRVDTTTDTNRGVQKEEPASPEEVIARSALPEGEHALPSAGLLYFPYKGKIGKLKSMELMYQGPYGEAALRLL